MMDGTVMLTLAMGLGIVGVFFLGHFVCYVGERFRKEAVRVVSSCSCGAMVDKGEVCNRCGEK